VDPFVDPELPPVIEQPDSGTPPPPLAECSAAPDCTRTDVPANSGLHRLDRCTYRLKGKTVDPARAALIQNLTTKLTRVSVGDVTADGNRTARVLTASDVARVSGFEQGFAWNDGDNGVLYWTPQGVTGSADSSASGKVDGKRVLLVAWYYDATKTDTPSLDKGVRISFVDLTTPGTVTYRHALLVDPILEGAQTSFRQVSVHAGGLAWSGRYLFVPATSSGFLVFDLGNILTVETDQDRIGWDAASGKYFAFGYKYVIPKVGEYRLAEGSCPLSFSYVSLDRSSSPPALVSGEYNVDRYDGRMIRWPFDLATGILGTANERVLPMNAFVSGHRRVQGGLMHQGKTYFSCSSQDGAYGKLYRADIGESQGFPWVDGPEDLYLEGPLNQLWTATEDVLDRYAFSVRPP
jgi:hypothetical protein